MNEIEIRPIVDDEVPAFCSAMAQGFGADTDAGHADRIRGALPLDRTLAAFDHDQIVGTFGDFPLQLTMPGGAQVDLAGTTMVTVRATHRRQGLLRSMMTKHLQDAVDRGDSLAGLWASETAIYGRFGYGLATELCHLKLDARRVHIDRPDSTLRLEDVPADSIAELAAPLWTRLTATEVGFIERDQTQWDAVVADPEIRRGGGSARRHIVVRSDDGQAVVGYACYRMKGSWSDAIPNGAVEVEIVLAESAEAHQLLWHYLTNVDLLPRVEYWNLPTDDALAEIASNRREIHREISDGLYLRILDTAAALTSRSYEADGSLRIKVHDDLGYAAGTVELRVESGAATVVATSADPDVSLDVRELSALLLGGRSALLLARLGLIVGEPAAIGSLDRLMRVAVTPWCPEEF